jgi:hypothetical protein
MHIKNASIYHEFFWPHPSYDSCDFMLELYKRPGRYTFMEVSGMINNFARKIEKNQSSTVYHGKLITGQEVVVIVPNIPYHSATQEFHNFGLVQNPNT